MRISNILRVIALTFVSCTFALVLSTCGGGKKGPVVQGFSPGSSAGDKTSPEGLPAEAGLDYPTEVSLDNALADLDALETPDGVDAELFAQLKAALAARLTTNHQQLTTGRFVSTPPTGEINRVDDLTISDIGGGSYTLTWHYKNLGDYDQDGAVAPEDIYPLAEHYRETYELADANCIQAVIDGSGNGVVDIADITAIAMNFGVDCAEYDIEQADTSDGLFTDMDPVSLSSATGDERKKFSVSRALTAGRWIRVVPADGDAAKGIAGSPALVICQGVEWLHTWGGSDEDWISGVAVDGSGNVYLTGKTNSFGAGAWDIILLKYNASGNIVWQKTWGGSDYDWGNSLAVDGSGNIYVMGRTDSFGAGSSDLILLKYSADGSLLWQKTWSGSEWEEGKGVAVDGSGNIYVTGDTNSFGAGSHDLILLKYSVDGSLLWQKTWGGSDGDWGYGVAVDESGDIYVTGRTENFGAGNDDLVLLKYSADGSLLWQMTWGGSDCDWGWGVAVDGSGNIYVTGRTNSFGVGDYDLVLLKFSPDGSLLSQKTWGGSDGDYGNDVAVDGSGDIYVTGFTKSFGIGSLDVILLMYSASGSLLSQKTWGGSDYDYGVAVVVDGGGIVYLTGEALDTYGSWDTPSGTETSPSGLETSPSGEESSSSGTEINPSGTETTPEGVEDEGGGGAWDALVMKIDPSVW